MASFMAGIKISFSSLPLWISCFDELNIEPLKATYFDRCTLSLSFLWCNSWGCDLKYMWSESMYCNVMMNTFTLPPCVFAVVWSFQLLFFYCPISSPDHLLSPSCRSRVQRLIGPNLPAGNSLEGISPPPQKKSDSNLKTCTRVAIPEWRTSGCES